jgi:hypothetical protein
MRLINLHRTHDFSTTTRRLHLKGGAYARASFNTLSAIRGNLGASIDINTLIADLSARAPARVFVAAQTNQGSMVSGYGLYLSTRARPTAGIRPTALP